MAKRPAKTAAVAVKPQPAKETAKKETAPRDKFACRVGSQAAAINAVISSTHKDAATIASAAKLPLARVRAHLKHLLGKQLIIETDKGFAVKSIKAK